MGIDTAGATFLLAARSFGVDFSETATLGRQDFFARDFAFRSVAATFQLSQGAEGVIEHCGGSGDKFLGLLGAKSVTSFDASAYEKATVVHDMNLPLPEEYRARFSAVFDGGTMEHVFNTSQFYRNALEMVRPGGHYLCLTCGNNMVGHGFYQFSPEFFFQSLTPENGFDDTVVMMCVYQDIPPSFYTVARPKLLKRRVELANSRPLYIFAISRRVEARPMFEQPPQQSDYEVAWERSPVAPGEQSPGVSPRGALQSLKTRFRLAIPPAVKPMLKRLLVHGAEGGLRQNCYRRLPLEQLARGDLRFPNPPA
jgi:hypothetical protein